jgi:parallel beta-helix repeat protein
MIIALCIPAYLVNNDYNHIHDYPKLVSPEEAVAFYDEYQKGHLPDTNVKVWKQPLIIDNANEEFKNKSIVQFNENVIFRPDPNYNYPYIYQGYRAAIIINKSDITIDLAGFTLALDPTSAPNFITNNPIYGIAIMPGVRNVTIKSATVKQPVQQGSIVGFSGYAIYALGESQTLNSYDPLQNFIKNLTIDNISISYNTSGIYIGYALLVDISNTDIVYNMSFRNGYGIYLYNVSQGEIRNARVNHNWAYNNSLGYCLENTVSMLIQKSQAKLNRSLKSGSAYGFTLLQSGSGTSYINEIMN